MMRLLHELQDEEIVICRGEYHYLRSGVSTGQVETWQITRLPDGTEIIRAEIDGQKSYNSVNLLTHYQRLPDGRPDWFRIRYERGDFVAAAQYNFEEAAVTVVRQAEGFGRRQEKIDIAINFEVDYHAVIAHDYVWRGYPDYARGRPASIPIVSPDLWGEGDDVLDGRMLRVNIMPGDPTDCEVPAGMFEKCRTFKITLDDGVKAEAWFDESGIPVRWYYPEKDYNFILTNYSRLV